MEKYFDDSSCRKFYDDSSSKKFYDDSSRRKIYNESSHRKFYDDSSCRKFYDDPSYRVLITDHKDMIPSFSAAIKAAVESVTPYHDDTFLRVDADETVDEEEEITDEEHPEEEDDDGSNKLEEDMSKFKPESTELSKENIRFFVLLSLNKQIFPWTI